MKKWNVKITYVWAVILKRLGAILHIYLWMSLYLEKLNSIKLQHETNYVKWKHGN